MPKLSNLCQITKVFVIISLHVNETDVNSLVAYVGNNINYVLLAEIYSL